MQIASQETGPVTVATAGDCLSVHDVAPNIRGVLAEEIAELRQQGIKVDGDNESAPENAQPTPNSTSPVLRPWVTPTTCPRRADPNCFQVPLLFLQLGSALLGQVVDVTHEPRTDDVEFGVGCAFSGTG